MKNKNIFALLIVAIFLSGCQSIPPVDFSVQDVGMVDHRKNAELKSLTVGFAPQAQQKTVEANATIPPLWKNGLQDAINRSLIFQDDQKVKVNLSVRIIEFDVPEFGSDMTTKVGAIYEVIDRGNGSLLYSELVESKGVVPFDYAFLGAARAVESWNRAIRNNIADFINSLDQADLTKPVFSGK
jgi:glutaredoxin-related protein